jgi:hypothetical protein
MKPCCSLAARSYWEGLGGVRKLLQMNENRLWHLQQGIAQCSLDAGLVFLYRTTTCVSLLGNSSTVEHRTLTPRI